MKLLHYTILPILIFSITIYSKSFYLGIDGGFCLSSFWGKDNKEAKIIGEEIINTSDLSSDELNFMPNLSFNLSTNIYFSNTFHFKPGIGYSRVGTIGYERKIEQGKLSGIDYEVFNKFHMDYVNIPIIFEFQFLNDRKICPTLFFGPQCSILFNSIKTVDYRFIKFTGLDNIDEEFELMIFNSTHQDYEMDIESSVAPYDVFFITGLKIKFKLKSGNITLDSKYLMGLLPFPEKNDLDINNYSLTFSLGYELSIINK
jgi:hypothetical protein